MDYNRKLNKRLAAIAAGACLAPADCIGKEFVFGQYQYRVLTHHSRKGTFTCAIINHFGETTELDETFVCRHCTPVTVVAPRAVPPRPAPRYSSVADLKIERRDETNRVPVVSETPVDNSLSQPETVSARCHTTKSPAHYLDQLFAWTAEDGTTYTFRVQLYNEKRDAFLLYDPDGCTGSFYREASFVYTHCQPADEPVVRQSFPVTEIEPTRFLNLLSITHPLHPLNPLLKQDGDS